MYLLSWIVVGLVAGWLGGKILKGDGYGTVMDIAMGIGGAVAGGLLMQSAGVSSTAEGCPSGNSRDGAAYRRSTAFKDKWPQNNM